MVIHTGLALMWQFADPYYRRGCGVDLERVIFGDVYTAASLLLLYIFMAAVLVYRLRRVRDEFYIARQLKMVIVIGVC